MRDLQTSGIVGLSASKVGYRYSDRHGEVNDKNVAVLPTVSCQHSGNEGFYWWIHIRGIKSF